MDANDKKTTSVSVSTSTPSGDTKRTLDMSSSTADTRKKKKGSSKATRRGRKLEKRVTKAMKRFASAADSGVDKYTSRRDKSDRKRKDGALIDLPQNVVRGMSKAMSKASPAFGDAMKVMSTKQTRKATRRNFRNMPPIPFM